MIKTIIFDFGNVFINLDVDGAKQHALNLFKIDSFSESMLATNHMYEKGQISTASFVKFYRDCFPNISEAKIIEAWNCVIKDFPAYRLDFLKNLSEEKKYNLILLSNTNDLHINRVLQKVPLYNDFKNYFNKFYLSHEIHLSKPSSEIFKFVLNENNLIANECLFIDDTKTHTTVATQIGINSWNINPNTEDVINLFKINKELF